jgi:hypothetical protein
MNLKLLIFPMSLVLTFFGFIYFIQPEWSSYAKSKDLLLAAEEKYKEIDENKINFDKILNDFSALSFEEKNLITKAMPKGLSEEVFLSSLNFILEDSGVILGSIDFKENKATSNQLSSENIDDIDQAKVDLKLNGNYFQLKKALYLLESLERLTLVDSYTLSKGSASKSDLSLTLNLTIFNKNKESVLNIKGNDTYLMNLLRSGLDIDFIKDYKEYRGFVLDFNPDKEGLGRDNLFTEEQLVDDTEEEDSEVEGNDFNNDELSPEEDEVTSDDEELSTDEETL